ncbi:serine/threonine-protein kinase [Crocosphaera sp. UHCC 0190]|uniref:serine/threonine-protein kinase n=1 Tax=Crocosphaera sp. UHCC 0190 TaxID=3110246 RepID=UPI002B20E5DB|nr:serine/threonine-protein kinase [Crocosphaera sp. UHCC 0190]MEA5510034.1 serine/threonine-protein kinase [Crocosphaera sp. UHCC 0190]
MNPTFPYRSNYRILGKIGQGQFGQVYFALRRHRGDFVALKNLGPGFPTNRFLREFAYLVSLRHPNIVACQAIEYHAKGRYLVMDYCEGGTLRNLMESSDQLSLETSLKLVTDILAGLEQAHQHKIIHCDIKPENILLSLTPQGWTAKITDFGISRLSQESLNLPPGSGYTGSPAYMAPERFYGKYSYGCDLYSVGIILYELILGERPFSGLPSDLMLAHLNQRIFVPDRVAEPLKAILLKALEKLPQRRFSSAKEMLDKVALAKTEVCPSPVYCLIALPLDSPLITPEIKLLNQVSFSQKISHLEVNNNNIYVGIDKQLTCLNYDDSSLTGLPNHQQEISFNEPIKTFEIRPQGCFILTKRKTTGTAQYSLYCYPNQAVLNSSLVAQILPPFESPQFLSSLDIQGKWLAVISTKNNHKMTGQFQVFNLPHLSIVHAPNICPIPSQLIALDHRYGLALFPRNSQGNKRTFLYLFNRRGRFLKGFSLPLLLSSLTPNPSNHYELFGMEDIEPHYGILIKLKPLKVTRIALDFMPKFIIAQDWGYGLANDKGTLLLLDRDGQKLSQIELSLSITAMTGFGEFNLLIASWSRKTAQLFTLDLRSYLVLNDD